MSRYKIHFLNKIEKINTIIDCSDNEYILDAAEKNNIDLPYSCRTGSCSTCVGKIIKGEIDQKDQTFLSKEHLDNNFLLTCISYPKSNLIIETHQEEELY